MITRKIIWWINAKLNRVFKVSLFDELYWKYRVNFSGDWESGGYTDSKNHPHRKLIINEIEGLKPKSVFEVGCNSAPNLQLIKEYFPGIKVGGLDISERAIKEARKLIPDGDFYVGTTDKLPFKSYDVVLYGAVLMYVAPDKIMETVKEARRCSRKGVIIVDRHKEGASVFGDIIFGHWTRDYKKIFEEMGARVKLRKLTRKDWNSYSWSSVGYIITVLWE